MTIPAVITKNLTVKLGGSTVALDDVSITLAEGKIIGVIGPSGAGKTTLIRAIVGRQAFHGGSVEVFGLPAGSAKLRSRISYMTQSLSVYADLTVTENLRYFCAMLGINGAAAKKEIATLLDTVDMQKLADQLVSRLSGGQKQRVSLAVSLIGAPKLMVLDEPTVGLDPVLRARLWTLFKHLAKNGTTLIIASHAMDEAEHCNDLLLLRDGRVLAHGSPADLRKQTKTDTIEQSFLHLVKSKVAA